jgi:hypothetical protein
MPQNLQPRRADRDVIGEIAQREGLPPSAVVRQMVDAWLQQHPQWPRRAEDLRALSDRAPATTYFGRRSQP